MGGAHQDLLTPEAAAVDRVERRRAAPPAITSLPAAWLLLSGLFATAAGIVLITTFHPAASGMRHTATVRAMDEAALLVALAILLLRKRLPRFLLNPALAISTLMITVATLASGGGSTAVAYGAEYLIGPVYCRFVLPQRHANAQLLFLLALGAPSLAVQPSVGIGEQVILWGVALIECSAVSWLVNALQQAESDSLTGLLNRKGFERVLGDALVRAPGDSSTVLVVLELDRFRLVNQSLGRAAGDLVLRDAARVWSAQLPAGTHLGRTGADGFALLMTGTDADSAMDVAEALRRSTPSPLGCSAGVVVWEDGESASTVLARAESAVQAAKRQGRGRTSLDPGTGREGRELRRALADGEFVPWFQPIVDLSTRRVIGAEALVRWEHPAQGVLSPAAFLSRAELSGILGDLGSSVLNAACAAAATWPCAPGFPAPYVSVNASSGELQDPLYAATVHEALASSGLDPSRLVIELVETHFEAESVNLLTNLHALRGLGVRTALDDFGVGYSSLDRLRQLTSDVIKIDKSFVDDIVEADQEVPLVAAVLAIAQALHLKVIAEGIEERVQAEWLADHGCDSGQGWLFGKPQPGESFRALLDDAGTPAARSR